MTRQTFPSRQIAPLLMASILLSACSTLNFNDAEPEKYMGMDCEALDMLAESYRTETQELLFEDVSDLERQNVSPDNTGVRDRARPYEIEQDRERRSVALARRKKGCI